jgi:hypothetical protein
MGKFVGTKVSSFRSQVEPWVWTLFIVALKNVIDIHSYLVTGYSFYGLLRPIFIVYSDKIQDLETFRVSLKIYKSILDLENFWVPSGLKLLSPFRTFKVFLSPFRTLTMIDHWSIKLCSLL